MKTVLLIFGTRPEAIKMCPLAEVLKRCGGIRTCVAVTGQHREMLDGVLQAFGTVPDYDLDLFASGRTLTELNAALLSGVGHLYREISPDLVLVHGDTATAFASATAAFFEGISVGHVEAGLRSGRIDSPFPEEFNRSAISLVSALDFAPTEKARARLLQMGKPEAQVLLTGNTVIDALRITVRADFSHPLLDETAGKRRILLTTHRRENLGAPQREIFRAVLRIVEALDDACVICPLHKNPAVRAAAEEIFGARSHPRVFLTEPLDTVQCHNLMARCTLVMTDSGGLQEEASALGRPLIVLRDTTERPEVVESGAAILCGCDGERIVGETLRLLRDSEAYRQMASPRALYGDGHASERIAEGILDYFSKCADLP